MACLVTGGAGFIGSHLVDELITQGSEVTVLDDLSEGKLDNLKRWKGDRRLEFVKGDIRDFETVRRLADGKNFVFHLAAMSRIQPSITDPVGCFAQNMLGTANVLEAARLGGVKRVVYSASSSCYGLKNQVPLREDMPSDCLNPYALGKRVGEEIVAMYHDLYGLKTASLRYFNVYGPRHQEEGSYATVIAIFRKQMREGRPLTIVGTGEKRRDFTFVGDVVRANMMAAMNRDAVGSFNIGTGVNYSINQVAAMVLGLPTVEEALEDGKAVYIDDRPAEAFVTLADASHARDVLGWKPQVNLSQGLEVIDLYERRNPPGSIVLA